MNKTVRIDGQEMDRDALTTFAIDRCIPEHCAKSLAEYITGDRPHIGHFLHAVLSNNLSQAVLRADDINKDKLGAYVRFLYSFAPASCWGSPERVRAWLDRNKTEE